MNEIRWGVIGCGHIANTFMKSMSAVSNATVVACAASDTKRAKDFAKTYDITSSFGSYNDMLADRSIHAIYVATTHNFHFEHIMLSLRHGKHVLCEKPLTLNAKQASAAFKLAEDSNLLLVEAVWTRFLPAIAEVKNIIKNGLIGEVQAVQANFSLNRDLPDTHRLLDPKLAGGALLDLGIYPITIADIVFDEAPINITSQHVTAKTGVDLNSFYTLEYINGKTAQLSAGSKMSGPTYANIMGDKGVISIPNFLGAKSFSVRIEGEDAKEFSFPFEDGHNFSFEIDSFTKALLNERQSSGDVHHKLSVPEMPTSASLRVMTIMDEIRAQWGLRYDSE